jgi:non-specific protein-tyrosine kinase
MRWWWLILASAIVAGATSLLYVRMRPDIYQSHATLVVGSAMQNPNPDNMSLQMGAYLARSYAQMAMRSTVKNATMDALQMEWLPEYIVEANPYSQMIELTVTDNDPVRAQIVATELVHQLVQMSPGGADAESRSRFAQEQLTKMESDISATEDEIVNRRDELGQATSARQIVSLEGEVAALETKLSSLRSNYVGLLSSTRDGAVNAINVLEAPDLPDRPEESSGILLVLLAAVMGGILATGGAYLLDFLDDSIAVPDQAEESLGLPMLGTVPVMSGANGGSPGHLLVMQSDPHTVAAEAFRVLRANVLFASVDTRVQMLQLTSPSPGDGKSSVSANLAIAMAQAGKRVILVDGDLRRPEQHRLFGLRNNHGITSAIIGDEHALAAALQPTAIPGLSVLTSGPLPPNPAELLGSRRMAALLETLKGLCDLLIVDSPPVSAVADTAVLASQADAVILVMWAGRTSRQQARYAINALRNARARVLGVVLNGVSRASSGYPFYHAVERYAEYGVVHARAARAVSAPPAPITRSAGSRAAQSAQPAQTPRPSRSTPEGFDLMGEEGAMAPAQAPTANPLTVQTKPTPTHGNNGKPATTPNSQPAKNHTAANKSGQGGKR